MFKGPRLFITASITAPLTLWILRVDRVILGHWWAAFEFRLSANEIRKARVTLDADAMSKALRTFEERQHKYDTTN